MEQNKQKQDRKQRLSQALRDNLRKRKLQKREKRNPEKDQKMDLEQPDRDK